MKSIIKSIARALSDYSLRKFLVYAVSPLNWPELDKLKRQAKNEKYIFFGYVKQWQNLEVTRSNNLCFIFHPWLLAKRKQPPEVMQEGVASDSESHDPEIRMCLDRLGWALQLAVYDPNNAWQAIEGWLEERWEKNVAYIDSYSISERVSNLILLWNIQEPAQHLGIKVLHMMEKDVDHLLSHLEYHGECRTNNHILNNARTLILSGSFLGCNKFYEAGCWLFDGQLAKHVSADGVVREASTHYQWVITRWIMEVGCAFHLMDQARFQQLCSLLKNMLDVCESMQLGTKFETYLPIIGDISPDFPPFLYGGMTRLGYALVECGEGNEVGSPTASGLWAQFFIGRTRTVTGNWVSADNSWARLVNNKWSLLAHSDTHPFDNRSTHGHHDLFSFEAAFEGISIVVDPGRKNYLAGRDQEEAGVLDEWHNTILVGGNRAGFIARGYMPSSWLARIRTQPQVEVEDRHLEIRLNVPREVPGISCIRRVLNLADENRLIIYNRLTKDDAAQTGVKLVMYVMGKVSLIDGRLKLEVGDREFTLQWKGLNTPVLRTASRYIGYGISELCTRLEWSAIVDQKEWESVFEIAPQEGGA